MLKVPQGTYCDAPCSVALRSGGEHLRGQSSATSLTAHLPCGKLVSLAGLTSVFLTVKTARPQSSVFLGLLTGRTSRVTDFDCNT